MPPALTDDQRFFRQALAELAYGREREAARLAEARRPGDPAAAAVLARLSLRHGRHSEALGRLRGPAAASPSSEAALELGLLQRALGRKAEARRTLRGVLDATPRFRTAEEFLRAARAARALGLVHDANALFRDALALWPSSAAINAAWGDLFLEKFQHAEAERSYREAIAADERWAPAYAGLARLLAQANPPAASAAVDRALDIDEGLLAAVSVKAELALDADRPVEARAHVARALEISPNSLPARSLAAAIAYVEGRTADFEAEVAAVLAINPQYGDVFRAAGNLAAQHYRFDEAAALLRRAVALEPDNSRAHADLGMHLLRTGDESAARRALEESFEADPFHQVTFNLLGMLDTLETFQTVEAGDALLRLHPSEAAVLAEYAVPLVESTLADLSARYALTPQGPLLVEIFPDHDDFAVRTLGLPGMLGALGACFGRVVTLDSPRARDPGTFNWQATLIHELAHVFSLQLSRQRVPRWVTEGVSVYEEGRVRPEWAREVEVPFVQQYLRGEVPRIRDLNAGFTQPDTVALAYFQAALLVEHIIDTHGAPALRALLIAYGEGLDTETAVGTTLGVDLDELQAAFDARLADRYGALARALTPPEGVTFDDLKDPAQARALAARFPDNYPVQLRAGRALAATGDREAAFAALERAAVLVPMATGPDSPHALMAALALESGDTDRGMRELDALLRHDHANVGAARELARLAVERGDAGRQWFAYERIVMLDPYDAGAHTALGRLALARRDLPLATREFRAALAAGPVDRASAHCDLGETYLEARRLDEAKREALGALEIAPTYERAQTLLLKAIGGQR